jgi:hypothetical protein
MNIAATAEPRIGAIDVTDKEIVAVLVDGRRITVPLTWSWRLLEATAQQRQHFEIIGEGTGVRWPDIDEDISIHGMLHGTPAPRPARGRGGKSKR